MQPTTITIDLDLTEFLRLHKGFGVVRDAYGDPEPGEEITGPITIEEIVLDLAARQVARTVTSEDRSDLGRRVRAIRDEVIREQVAPQIADVLDRAIRPTTQYGEPTGEATTLREVIVKEAGEALAAPKSDRSGFGLPKLSPLAEFIQKEVRGAFRKELAEAVKEAQDEVRAAVKDQAAAVITETVTKLAEGRRL